MSALSVILIASLTYMIPVAIMIGIALGWRHLIDRDNRRSPLTHQQIHLPGEQIRQRLEKLDEDFTQTFFLVCLMGPVLAMMWLLLRLREVDWSGLQLGTGDVIFGLAVVGLPVYGATKLIRIGRKRRRFKQGLAGELATAQLLMPLQAEGCQIFHDIPAPGFNIDHVVVGPHAVFAVESKSRLKARSGGKAAAVVRYDGSRLAFPEHVETKPLDQARAQARWLAEQLSRGTGETVKVVPALSLPGWYVELTREGSRSDVVVFNPKMGKFMTSRNFGAPIEASQQRRIAHILTMLYPQGD